MFRSVQIDGIFVLLFKSTLFKSICSRVSQLTLETPRASAGAAESALSEEPRASLECDVNDHTEQVRHHAPVLHSACSLYLNVRARNKCYRTNVNVGVADVAPSVSPFSTFRRTAEEEEERLYHKGQQSSRKQHDQPISHKLTKVASGWLTTN